MNALEIPEFTNWREEAEYWDRTDASFMLEEKGEWVEPGRVRAAPDLCRRCGGQMALQRLDIQLAHGRLTLHEVEFYVCPRCGTKTLSPQRQDLFTWREVKASSKAIPSVESELSS